MNNIGLICSYFLQHWVELLGTLLSLIYLYLSINQRVSFWFFGIISSALYIVVFLHSKLYADFSLQVYYVIVSIYGWINWKKGNPQNHEFLPISRLSSRAMLVLLIILVSLYFFVYSILKHFTDTNVPEVDALIGALSIVGTWLLARKYLENWLFWVVADTICAGLYVYKQLLPTAVLYVVYALMSVVGFLKWKKEKDQSLRL